MREILAFSEPSIGTGRRQPFRLTSERWRHLHTVFDQTLARIVARASASAIIKKFTSDRSVSYLIAFIVVCKLDETAARTAIAQRFPFVRSHILQ